jgi:hypothetical protein
MGRRIFATFVVVGAMAITGVAAFRVASPLHSSVDAGLRATSIPATTRPPSTTPTTTTTTTTSTTTSTTAVPLTAAAVGPDLGPYRGLGTWIDVYDWSEAFNRYQEKRVGLADIDAMAAAGVQTLYVQTSKWDAPTDVLEPHRLLPMVARAKERGLSVVAWYLPTFVDPQADMARLMAASRIPGVDALAVDIESSTLDDVAERNRRLLLISTNLRAALPDVALGAIPYPPVVTDVLNRSLWPSFPWRALAPLYDVWLPMSYQSNRTVASGYRDAYRYTGENIDRMRAALGDPDVPVHTIGGIADETGPPDVAAMHRAAVERGALGGSLYDWRTTAPTLWPALHPFRHTP